MLSLIPVFPMLMLVVTVRRPWHSRGGVPSLLQCGLMVTLVLGMAHRLDCNLLLVTVSHEHFSVVNTGFCVSVTLNVHCHMTRGLYLITFSVFLRMVPHFMCPVP